MTTTTTSGAKVPFVESGINEEYIENYDSFSENILASLECPICAGIVNNPYECKNCQTIYCQECWKQLEISNKGCVMRCKNPKVEKANKFVFGLLEKFLLKCPLCQTGSLNYQKFLQHFGCCIIANKYGTIEELTKLEKEKDEEIEKLKHDIEKLKTNSYQIETKYTQEELRKELITSKLDVNSKMILYQAAVKGELNDFKKLIDRGYPLLEEVSAANFYWTPLHYAMHYGKMEIAFYILDLLKQQGKYRMAMELESNDKRTPVLCLLKSNALSLSDKKEYFTRLIQRYDINPDERTIREIKNRNLEDIYKKYQGSYNK
jgi:hypothetical protein